MRYDGHYAGCLFSIGSTFSCRVHRGIAAAIASRATARCGIAFRLLCFVRCRNAPAVGGISAATCRRLAGTGQRVLARRVPRSMPSHLPAFRPTAKLRLPSLPGDDWLLSTTYAEWWR